jgi:hypothetical protein
VSRFGGRRSVLTCSALLQLPSRNPTLFAPFTRRMPAAKSGLRRPTSAGSYASRRTAASRRLMVDGESRRDSNSSRYRSTTVLLNARRRFRAVPGNEIVDCESVRLLRLRRSKSVQDGAPGKIKIWQAQDPVGGMPGFLAAHRPAVSLPARRIDANALQSTRTPFLNMDLSLGVMR